MPCLRVPQPRADAGGRAAVQHEDVVVESGRRRGEPRPNAGRQVGDDGAVLERVPKAKQFISCLTIHSDDLVILVW